MINIKLVNKNKTVNPSCWDKLYENLIVKKIRAKYSINQELAILRQRDSKPDEFNAYNSYVEQCKAAVKAEMEGA